MPRFEFDGRFAFPDTPTENAFGADVDAYIASHPNAFAGYTPISSHINYHGTSMWHVQARFTSRNNLNALFAAIKPQAINHGAVLGSTMWLKQIADGGGVTDGVQASAPGWVDGPVT